jgi:hypothetical protein
LPFTPEVRKQFLGSEHVTNAFAESSNVIEVSTSEIFKCLLILAFAEIQFCPSGLQTHETPDIYISITCGMRHRSRTITADEFKGFVFFGRLMSSRNMFEW